MAKKKKKTIDTDQVHMAGHPSNHGWFNGKEYIAFEQMSDVYLERAKFHVQKMMLVYFHKMNKLDKMIDKLEEEARRRGKILGDYKSKFHQNEKAYKERHKNDNLR